jgi:hypothetical protein
LTLDWWSLVKGYGMSKGEKSEKGVKGAKGKKQNNDPPIAPIDADSIPHATALRPLRKHLTRLTGFTGLKLFTMAKGKWKMNLESIAKGIIDSGKQ